MREELSYLEAIREEELKKLTREELLRKILESLPYRLSSDEIEGVISRCNANQPVRQENKRH